MAFKGGRPIEYTDVETKTASWTLTDKDSGKLFVVNAVDLVATLPSAALTPKGVVYAFFVLTASATTGFSLDPNSADKIQGKGITAADNKDYVNSSATDAVGDYIEVVCDGVDGWLVTDERGTWAREA